MIANEMIIGSSAISSLLVVIAWVVLTSMSLFFPRSLNLLKLNKIPYQFEWLIQSLTSIAAFQVYTILNYTGLIIQKPEHYYILLWMTSLGYLYHLLFMTKYTTRAQELPLRVYTLVSHIVFGWTMFFIIIDIFIIRNGGIEYQSQNYNIYNIIYDAKSVIFIIEIIASILYTFYTLTSYKYRISVIIQKVLVQFGIITFVIVYSYIQFFYVYVLVYDALAFALIIATYYNVFVENGRFLTDGRRTTRK